MQRRPSKWRIMGAILGDLSSAEIENVLHENVVGRIGSTHSAARTSCRSRMRTMAVPFMHVRPLHGGNRPNCPSADNASYASLGLHAPRIRYGRNSLPSFSRSVVPTSISQSTPKPSSFSSVLTRSTACSGGKPVATLPYAVFCKAFFIDFRNLVAQSRMRTSREPRQTAVPFGFLRLW